MNPNEAREWIEKATVYELVNSVIWESIMYNTAHCGWTDKARDGLVKDVQDSVKWALDKKLNTEVKDES